MRLFTSGLSLALLSFCFLGLAGCGEDNEAAIKEQASKAKGTIPGSRTAQAQTQEEYYEITPGVQGVGTAGGPRPDRGIAGYPRAPK
jgi:ABC-type phosphate transport system substrate-binding protein